MVGDTRSRVCSRKCACRAAHFPPSLRVVHDFGDQATKARRVEIGLGKAVSAASHLELSGIRSLVIIHGTGEGHQQGWTPGRGQLGDGRRAGTGDDQVGGRQPVRHVAEKGGDFGIQAKVAVGLPQGVDLFGAALLDDAKAGPDRAGRVAMAAGTSSANTAAPSDPPTIVNASGPSVAAGRGLMAKKADRTGMPEMKLVTRSGTLRVPSQLSAR